MSAYNDRDHADVSRANAELEQLGAELNAPAIDPDDDAGDYRTTPAWQLGAASMLANALELEPREVLLQLWRLGYRLEVDVRTDASAARGALVRLNEVES